MRHAIDRHARFRHRLQESGLGAGGGAVDFVGQQNLREYRAGTEDKFVRLLIEDGRPRDVAGKQIGRALHPLESATDTASQSAGQHGLGDPGNVLQKDMPPGKPGNQRQDQLLAFSHNRLFYVGDDFLGHIIGGDRHT